MAKPGIESEAIKQQIIIRFWPVAVIFFLIFTPLSFFVIHDYLSGWFLLGSFFFFISGMVIYATTKRIGLISNMLAFLGIPVLLPWLITGGPAQSGFWWSVVYAIWAFSVASEKSAMFWLAIHLLLSAVVVTLSEFGWIRMAYTIPELLNILLAFLITFTLIFLFNKVLVHYLDLANKRAELVLINRELISENRDLVSENRELEQFAYIASHDLQEPLRNITNFAGLLENRLGKNEDTDVSQILKVIMNSADRMKILIRDLLAFSKIGRDTVKEKINCAELFREVFADMATVIKETEASIVAQNLPVISGNRTEIKQLFQNLISNAIKFRKDNALPDIIVRCESDGEFWKFSVHDNGIGIHREHRKRIFLIFQRLHSPAEYAGTGIGLAICRKIVETAGGIIWVTSKPGLGSVFWFTLPKAG